MKIIDIVKTTATLIAREDVVSYLTKNDNEPSLATLETVDLLTRLTNMVIRELAEGIIVMKKEVEVNGENSVKFSSLGIEPLDILAVYDENGKELEFKTNTYGVSACGNLIYKVEYSYLPSNYDLSDMVGEFIKPVSANLLAYGVCAEFCLVEARFDEAIMWNDRYVNGVHLITKPKNGRVKGRNFI